MKFKIELVELIIMQNYVVCNTA